MRTISYRIGDLKKAVIEIGYVAENEHTRVNIDASEVFSEYPQAVATLTVQPPKGSAYPATVTRNGDTIVWDIKDSDLVNRGEGEIQLTFTEGTVVVKSCISRISISRSIVGNGEAPEPVQDWINDANELLADLEEKRDTDYWKGDPGTPGEPGQPGQDGHTPVLTSNKTGKTTTIYADGQQLAQIQDGQDGQGGDVIDDTAGEGDTDKTWSADKLDTELSDVKNAIEGVKRNPYEFGMAADRGYITGTTTFGLDRSSIKSRVLFGWLPCGKGTEISVDTSKIVGFCVYIYNMMTGEYVDKPGNVNTNKNPIVLTSDAMILVYANTNYDDVTDYYDILNKAVFIKYAEPSVGVVPYQTSLEYGSIDGNTGNPSGSSNTRLRSSEFMLVGKGTTIYMPNTRSKINVYWYGMDGSCGFINKSGNYQNPVYIIPQDMHVKFLFTPWAGTEYSSINEVSIKMVFVEPKETHLPEYYEQDNYIQARRDRIIGHMDDCAYNGLMFYFITDVHWASNVKRSPVLLKYLKERTGVCDLIFNGDAITSEQTKVSAVRVYNEFRNAFGDFEGYHWMPVIGNHEYNNPSAAPGVTGQLTASEAYGLVIKENERIISRIDEYSYYIDFTTVKIRIIFVGADYQALVPSATRTAVVSAINATPQDYKILVCSHIGLTGKGATGEIETSLQTIVDALDLVHDRVIAVMTGHRHADGYLQTEAGVNIIATTCDAKTEGGGLTRTVGTTDESAFDVVQIDLTNSKIYLTRIGAGDHRTYDICQ